MYNYAQLAPSVLLRLSILPISGNPEPKLESLLRDTIALALTQGPFIAINADARGAEAQELGLELKVLYALRANRVSLRLSFRDQSASLPSRDDAMELELDPQFDQTLSALVLSLLSESAALVAARPASPATALKSALPKTATAVQEMPSPAAVENDTEFQSMPQAGSAPPLRAPGPPASFETGLGAFVPLGEAGVYFDAALRLHALYGRYLNEGKNWRLALAGSFMGFSVSGESQEKALNFFALLGGELGYSIRPGAGIDPWLAAGLGPALVVVGAEGVSPLAKILPYLSIGLGSNFMLSRSLSLGLGLSWSLFLDYGRGSSYLLMGLNPSLAARLEL
jgi:hypothetical protein